MSPRHKRGILSPRNPLQALSQLPEIKEPWAPSALDGLAGAVQPCMMPVGSDVLDWKLSSSGHHQSVDQEWTVQAESDVQAALDTMSADMWM